MADDGVDAITGADLDAHAPADISSVIAGAQALPNANTGDPVADQFTWEDTGNPALEHPAANVPAPFEQPSPISTPHGQSVGGSISTERRGMTPGGLAKSSGLFGDAEARANARAAGDDTYTAGAIAQNRKDYGAVGEATSHEVDAINDFKIEEERLRQQEMDFNKGAAELEQRLAGEAQAEKASYISAYKEQLAVVRQLGLQSGNPMNNLSKGQAIGLAGAQFAQGFLAAQGIQIDVAGQVDRWVDRSIQEHQMKIANARDVAQDQLHLYEVARQNSQDDWEARQRYRGFVIAGLQSAIALNASRFQSDIAAARANEQVAKLQVEADSTERAIGDAHLARVSTYYQQEYDAAYKRGQLAIEQTRNAISARAQAWDESPKNPKNIPKVDPNKVPPDLVIPDADYLKDKNGNYVQDANGNKIQVNRWRVGKEISKDETLARDVWTKGAEARQKYGDYLTATNDMLDKYAAAKKIRDATSVFGHLSWDQLDRMDQTGAVHDYLQSRDRWVLAKVYNDSGKAVNQDEFKRQSDQAYKDLLIAENGNKAEKSMAQLRENGRRTFENHMTSYGFEEIPEDDPKRKATEVTASPRTAAEDTAMQQGVEAQPGFAAHEIGDVSSRSAEHIKTQNISGTWADYQRNQISNGQAEKLGQPEYAVAIDHLAVGVIRPSYMGKYSQDYAGVAWDKMETPSEIRASSYQALQGIARGVNLDGGGEIPTDAQLYAQHLLDQLDADPVVSKVLESGSDEDVQEAPIIKRLSWRPGK